MQIRQRGKRTEFLRAKYDPETKTSPAKLIGSQESFLHYLEPDLAEKMEPHELEEVEAYFAKKKEQHNAVMRRMAVKDAPSSIKEAADALASGQELKDADQAVAIYEAMDQLAKQLKRAGYPKSVVMPKKGKKSGSKPAEDRQTDAFSEGE